MLSVLCGLQENFHLKLPPYPGTSQCVKIGSSSGGKSDPSQIRLNYDLAEKGGGLLEEHVDADPMKQFDKWFQVCSVFICHRKKGQIGQKAAAAPACASVM